jgi:hypothetical protein
VCTCCNTWQVHWQNHVRVNCVRNGGGVKVLVHSSYSCFNCFYRGGDVCGKLQSACTARSWSHGLQHSLFHTRSTACSLMVSTWHLLVLTQATRYWGSIAALALCVKTLQQVVAAGANGGGSNSSCYAGVHFDSALLCCDYCVATL